MWRFQESVNVEKAFELVHLEFKYHDMFLLQYLKLNPIIMWRFQESDNLEIKCELVGIIRLSLCFVAVPGAKSNDNAEVPGGR